jgi:hypothetical protein
LQLSREHHAALVLSRDIAGTPAPMPSEVLDQYNTRIARYWQAELQAHFQQEEAILAQHPNALPSSLVQRLLADHGALAEGVRQAQIQTMDEVALRAWGQRLAAHVRMEERECFPLMQAALGLN